MPTYVYSCPVALHGEFNVFMASYPDEVPKTAPCSVRVYKGDPENSDFDEDVLCNEDSEHVIKPIAAAIVSGGTGGGKDMHLKR
ncbi:hypothetical protein LCGC14_2657660 [marine sediment metagenome]|uniref:Uncharacterized protein n=1 Tax=marine sediment metagenome TaxID=412755 RepID=A0A0F9CJZ7_9ZZZZ